MSHYILFPCPVSSKVSRKDKLAGHSFWLSVEVVFVSPFGQYISDLGRQQRIVRGPKMWPKLCEGCRMIDLLESDFQEAFVCHRCQLVDHLQSKIWRGSSLNGCIAHNYQSSRNWIARPLRI